MKEARHQSMIIYVISFILCSKISKIISLKKIKKQKQQKTVTAQRKKVKVKLFSCVQLSGTPWTVAYQAFPSMGFSRQQFWSGLSFPSPGDLPDPGIKPRSLALQKDALPWANQHPDLKRALRSHWLTAIWSPCSKRVPGSVSTPQVRF